MFFYKLVVSIFCLMMAVGLAKGTRMRRRRGECEYGTHPHEGKTCCMCPSGYRVKSDCTDNSSTQCEICVSGTFAAQPNYDRRCWSCKVCDSKANMKEEEKCSRYTDTVCGCLNDHYCDKAHLCRACQPCNTCEKQGGVKIPCTQTYNTVCNGAKLSNGATKAAVLVPLILIILGVLLFLWKKQMFCFGKTQKQMEEDLQAKKPLKQDVDLNPYLQEITSIMQPKLMKDVARRTGMSDPDIEQHALNHPRDVREQTYKLLQEWSQAQGLNEAYPTLINNLLELKAKRTAHEIRQIVEREQATNVVKYIYRVK